MRPLSLRSLRRTTCRSVSDHGLDVPTAALGAPRHPTI